MSVDFRVLGPLEVGPLEVWSDGVLVPVPAGRARTLLNGRPVPRGRPKSRLPDGIDCLEQ